MALFNVPPEQYLKKFGEMDSLGSLFGVRYISIDAKECICEYDPKPAHHNPNGILHGGALFSVMDSCQGAFVHYSLDNAFSIAATGTATIKYLAPVREGTIRVRSWLKEIQGRKIFVSSSAIDSNGTEVAQLEEIWIAKLNQPA